MHAFSNHTYVVGARWLGLMLTALLLFIQQRPVDWWSLWFVVVFVTFMLTMSVQPAMRMAVRHAWILGVDIALAAVLIVSTDPWNSPFFLYACAVLALPAVIGGWRGGLLAGLLCSGVTFVLVPLLDVSFGTELPHVWLRWGVVAIAPALVGGLLPTVLVAIRGAVQSTTTLDPTHELPARMRTIRERDSSTTHARWWQPRTARTSDSMVAVGERVETLRVVLNVPVTPSDTVLSLLTVYAERFEQHALIATRVVLLGRPQPVDTLYIPLIRRVVVESLLNVAQHAQADAVVIMIRYDQRTMTVLIHDDGSGLPVTGIHRPGIHSLQALMYRTNELGGRLEVFNHTPAGVAVRLILPLIESA